MQSNVQNLNQNIRIDLLAGIEQVRNNYIFSDLRIGDRTYNIEQSEFHDAVMNGFNNDLNKDNWNPDEDLQKIEERLQNLALQKLASDNEELSESAIANASTWAKMEAQGYLNILSATPEYIRAKDNHAKVQVVKEFLEQNEILIQHYTQSLDKINDSLEKSQEALIGLRNPDSQISLEMVSEIYDEGVKNLEVANELQSSVVIEKREDISRALDVESDFDEDDDFDLDADPSEDNYSPPAGFPPSEGPPPDGSLPPPYPNDLGPPPTPPPPDEPDPGDTPPPIYHKDDKPEPSTPPLVGNQFSDNSNRPIPSAPPKESINDIQPLQRAASESFLNEVKIQPSAHPRDSIDSRSPSPIAGQINMPPINQPQARSNVNPNDKRSISSTSTGRLLGEFFKADKSAASKVLDKPKDKINLESKSVSQNQSKNIQPEVKNNDLENKHDDSKPRGLGRR